MTSENIKTLEFNRYQKSDKTTFAIYADLKCIKENIGGRKNGPENSSTIKVSKYIPFNVSNIFI